MTMIPNYTTVQVIYQDGKAGCYRAYYNQDKTPVILKFFQVDYPTSTDIAQLKHEYQITHDLDVVGIIKPYKLEIYSHNIALLFADFTCQNLRQYIQEGKLEILDFLQIAIRLSEILNEIHEHNIIHKKINPDNILIEPTTQQIKITNFSVASQLLRENQAYSNPELLKENLAYLSPEQTGRMNRSVDYRTDFYSLGVIFYEMLTGVLPFQSLDSMELVHCHIAKKPISPHELNADIPEVLSQIIEKLLSKMAEDRYQSAYGIKLDLEVCLSQWQKSGRIKKFSLAQKDFAKKLHISQKLYGREKEVIILLETFARVSQGETEIVLVSGFSGVGKTSLVNEIHKPIVDKRGYFVTGKFSQLKRDIPYYSLIAAFRELILQLLTEPEEKVQQWRAKLLKALGTNCQVIIDVIPEVELIIGKQNPAFSLATQESQNRFNYTLQQFIHVFTQKDHPLVLFFDDLQWADLASLKLIQFLLTQSSYQYLLIIGTYRNNEVSASHPLMMAINSIQQSEAKINYIVLQPLEANSLTQLILDTFNCKRSLSRPLAELILSKTHGNPFFVNQLLISLYKDNFLRFDFQKISWIWDIERIKEVQITDNVIEFMIDKIKLLPEKTQEILQVAACIGNQFDLKTLSILTQKDIIITANSLWKALEEGLILPVGNYYKITHENDVNTTINNSNLSEAWQVTYNFLHDRVQQAVYSFLSEEEKKVIHFKIGNLMLKQTPDNALEEKIFEIVNHLNLSSDLIRSSAEKYNLAKFNLIAGEKAKKSTAYEAALVHLTKAINLLGNNSWKTHYKLTLSLSLECSECEYLNSNFADAEHMFNSILDHVKTKVEQAKVYILKITLYTNLGKFKEAINIGMQCLNLFGLDINTSDIQASIKKETTLIKTKIANTRIKDLYDLPIMTNKNSIAIMNILMSLSAPAYFTDLDLWTFFMLKMTNRSLRYGNTDVSSLAYMAYGSIVGSTFGDYQGGYEFGKLALKVNKKFENTALRSKIYLMFGTFISHWRKHVKEDFIYLKKAFDYGNETGDPTFSAYAAGIILDNLYIIGEPLNQIDQELKIYLDFVEKGKIINSIYFHKLMQRVILDYQELTPEKSGFSDDNLSEEKFIEKLCSLGLRVHLTAYYRMKAQFLYLLEDNEKALALIKESEKLIKFSFGLLRFAEHYFYQAIILLSTYEDNTEEDKDKYWKTLIEHQEKFKVWSDNCPENFLHKYLLISAEIARLSKQDLEAMELYEQAIASAQANGYIQNEALANELTAKFYLSKGQSKIAQLYFREAYYGYEKWGATIKVKHLEKKYPEFFSDMSLNRIANSGISQDVLSLDLATVIKGYQTLSSEIALGKLLEKLMKTVIENAGAQKGFLILDQQSNWVIEAEASVDSDEIITLQSIPYNSLDPSSQVSLLSVAIVNYVVRTQQDVVLNDATHEGTFTTEPHILATQPKSLLCTPLLHQGKLSGILYLENNLTTNAFTPERVELLRILSVQAAISIENSRLYEQLEDYSRTLETKVVERTQELEQKNEELATTLQQLKATQTQIIAQEKLASLGALTAGIAHEIKNPLNFVNNFAELSVELTQELLAEIENQKQQLDAASVDYIEEILSDIRQNAQRINEHGKRADKIVQGMLLHSRGEKEVSQQANINDLLAESLNLAYHGIRAKDASFNISIETDYDQKIEPFYVMPQDINRVFLNIINNACYSVQKKKIELSNKLEQNGEHFLPTVSIFTKNLADFVEIRIRDNGKGIPPAILDKIFNPFFTTKPTGEGTGLGLSISHDIIVQEHQGKIEVDTEVDKYTEFTIILPKNFRPKR